MNISAPSKKKIKEAKDKAKNRRTSVSKIIFDHFDSLPLHPVK